MGYIDAVLLRETIIYLHLALLSVKKLVQDHAAPDFINVLLKGNVVIRRINGSKQQDIIGI